MANGGKSTILGNARSHPLYDATLAACRHIVALVRDASGRTRRELHALVRPRVQDKGLKLSSDTAKAVDSMLDILLAAKTHDLLDVPGGLSSELVAVLFAVLYLKDSPDIRIESIDLTHVPMVVQGNLEAFLLRRGGSRPETDELKAVFLQALFHDAGKWDLNIRTRTGFVFAADSPFNSFTQEVAVAPGESLTEAMQRLDLAPSLVPKYVTFITPILVHPDALSVRRAVEELRDTGVVGSEAAEMMWKAVMAQGFVSSWTIRNAFRETRICSRIYDPDVSPAYRKYLELYRTLTEFIRNGVTPDELLNPATRPEEALLVEKLRREVEGLPDNEVAMLLGDHQGQNDIVKYLDIQTLKPATRALTVHQLIFGRNRPASGEPLFIRNWMENSIEGVLLTHTYEQRLLDPFIGECARRGFESSLAWLHAPPEAPGLARSVLSDKSLASSFELWKNGPGKAGGVMDWLDGLRVFEGGRKGETYLAIRGRVERGFYDFYAPRPENLSPSRFTMRTP